MRRRVIVEKAPKPSKIYFYEGDDGKHENGYIVSFYNLEGELHREGDEPAQYDDSGRCWFYKKGELIKMENMETSENQIKEILEEFDFHKVEVVMDFLDWKWAGDTRSPTVEELKDLAKTLLEEAFKQCYENGRKESYSGTGGFTATYYLDQGFLLEFNLEQWQTIP